MKIKNNYLYGIAIVEERDKKFQNIKLYTFVRTFFLYAYYNLIYIIYNDG